MSNGGAHVCVLCNSKMETKEALKDHFRQHANKEIDVKGRRLTPSGELQDWPDGSKPYIKGTASQIGAGVTCDVCGEKFACNTKAIQHKFRKHPLIAAKHYCPECGMQFPLKGHRDKHVTEQHGTVAMPPDPFPCYQCGAVFYTQAAYEYHDKSAHHRVVTLYKQIETPPPSKKIRYNNAGDPQSVYYCHLCGFEYIVKFNLQKHLERQHSRDERGAVPEDLYKCNTCDGLFYNQKAYHNHTMYHRPDDLYVTSEEQRLATVTRVDQDFDIRRVQPAAEKYVPRFRRRRTNAIPKTSSYKQKNDNDDDDEELSPASEDSSSDSDQPQAKIIKTIQ